MSYAPVVEGEPLEPGSTSGRFNGEGGVRKAWWWEAGPVDSCCFCCSLRAGVAILATIDLLYKGIWTTFYVTQQVEDTANHLLSQLQPMYDRECTGARAQTADCQQIEETIEILNDEIQLFDHLPAAFYIQGVIAIIAGIAGLLAVFNSNALAAKVYMWTWLPRFLAMVVTEWVMFAKLNKLGLENNPGVVVLSEVVNLFFILYFIKVLWSYQKRLDGSSGDSSLPSTAAVSVQLRSGMDGV